MRILANAYGLNPTDRDRLPAAIRERLRRNERFWRGILDDHSSPIPRARSAEVLAWTQRELAYTEADHKTFIAALR